MESEKGKETVGHVRSEAEEEQTKVVEEVDTCLPSPSSSASSSLSSSPRGSFEHDVTENSPPNNDSISKSKREGELSQGHNRPSQAPERSDSSNASSPQTTSPPVQKMEQSFGYDPNRIPASIFASKPANASEWSVASNDSLFSIHVGNNSFTKDQFKSGEILRLDDQSSLHVPEAKSNELSSLPPLMEVPPHEESSSVKSSNVSTLEEEEAMKGSSTPRPSHESTATFAFPVLEGEGGKNSPLQRVEEQKQEGQTQDTSNADEKSRYFSWCPCLPRCC